MGELLVSFLYVSSRHSVDPVSVGQSYIRPQPHSSYPSCAMLRATTDSGIRKEGKQPDWG